MNEVNFQASVNNMVQMDRFQNDASRAPVVNQAQNAGIEQTEAEQRIQMPVQPEQADGKKVDPRQRKPETREKKKRRKPSPAPDQKPEGKSSTGGFFVDLQA